MNDCIYKCPYWEECWVTKETVLPFETIYHWKMPDICRHRDRLEVRKENSSPVCAIRRKDYNVIIYQK